MNEFFGTTIFEAEIELKPSKSSRERTGERLNIVVRAAALAVAATLSFSQPTAFTSSAVTPRTHQASSTEARGAPMTDTLLRKAARANRLLQVVADEPDDGPDPD